MNKHAKGRAVRRCRKVIEALEELFPCKLRTSQRGVPHVVVRLTCGRDASVCWMGKAGKYRCFFPYGEYAEQEKSGYQDLLDTVFWLDDLDEREAALSLRATGLILDGGSQKGS